MKREAVFDFEFGISGSFINVLFPVYTKSMFGGSGSDDGVWGFAALARGVKGLGLEAEQVEGQARNFGAWRRKADEDPDSPEEKQAGAFRLIQVEFMVYEQLI